MTSSRSSRSVFAASLVAGCVRGARRAIHVDAQTRSTPPVSTTWNCSPGVPGVHGPQPFPTATTYPAGCLSLLGPAWCLLVVLHHTPPSARASPLQAPPLWVRVRARLHPLIPTHCPAHRLTSTHQAPTSPPGASASCSTRRPTRGTSSSSGGSKTRTPRGSRAARYGVSSSDMSLWTTLSGKSPLCLSRPLLPMISCRWTVLALRGEGCGTDAQHGHLPQVYPDGPDALAAVRPPARREEVH